jgi:MFS family permease
LSGFSVFGTLSEAAASWRELLQDPNQQGLCAANLGLYLNYAAAVAVVPLQAHQYFGSSSGEIGALYGIGSLIGIKFGPAAGLLSDRYGRVPLVLPSIVLCAASCAVLGNASEWQTFFFAYMVWSAGQAVVSPVLLSYTADIAPREKASAAMSLSRQSQDVVFLIGPMTLGAIYDASPGAAAMLFTAALSVVCGGGFHRLAREVAKQ